MAATMIKRSLKTLAFVAVTSVSATAAAAESLADAMVSAYNHSGLLDQNRATLRAADEDVAIAVAALRPVINWAYTNTHTSTPLGSEQRDSFSVIADLLVYDFGASKLAIEAQKEIVLATRAALVQAEQDVLLNAVTAYMNLRRDYEFLNLRQNNLRVITQEYRAAQDRFDVGEVTRTDVALAEARLALAKSNLAGAKGNLARSIEFFRSVTGRKPGKLTQPPRAPKIPSSAESAKATALRIHPAIKEVQHRVTAAELGIKVAEASLNPTVNLNARVSILDDFETSEEVGVTVGGPVYHGGALNARIRNAAAGRDQARAGLHIARHQIALNVGNAYAGVQVARSISQASEQQIRASRVAFRGVREEATLGSRTTLDVLNAEQELLDAQANQISAVTDEYIAVYTLLAAMGQLTAQNLNLGVTTYDPTEYYNLVKNAPAKMSKQGAALDRVLKSLGKQ